MITLLIIIVTIGISYQGFTNDSFLQDWMHKPKRVKQNNEWKRLVTSGFIHADWMHLIFNMLTLYFFGEVVENLFVGLFGYMGYVYFILFYLSATFVASYPTQKKMENNGSYASLGASGAVSAVVFASIMIYPMMGIHIIPFTLLFDDGLPGFIYAPLYLWYSNYMSRQGRDNINHDAHYFGAIYGVLIIVLIFPSSLVNFYDSIVRWINIF